MKKHISARLICALILGFLFLCAAGIVSFANGPVPRYCFDISVSNPPQGSYGIDFLLPKDQIPAEEYTDCNPDSLRESDLPEDCELVSFEQDGYVSYMLHDSNGHCDGLFYYHDGTDSGLAGLSDKNFEKLVAYEFRSGYGLLPSLDNVRLVVFDKSGNVLSVSDPFKVYESKPRFFYGEIKYDAATGEAATVSPPGEGGKDNGGGGAGIGLGLGILFSLIAVVLALIFAMLFTMLIEFLIALIFKLKPASWVLLVNLVSNLLFNLLLLVCCVFLNVPYYGYIIAGELVVIAAEYFVYTRLYEQTSRQRLLVFSVVANLCSALLFILAGRFFMG